MKNPLAERAGKPLNFSPKPAAFCNKFPQGVFPSQPFEIETLSDRPYFSLRMASNLPVQVNKFTCTGKKNFLYR
jgi:hypothetical protein